MESNWIKTSSKLPEFDTPVLVFCKIYGRYIGSYNFIGEAFGEKHGNWHDGKQLGVLPPTHWQPLPERPPMEKDEVELMLIGWPTIQDGYRKGDFICTKEKPMPIEAGKLRVGHWEHDDVHETDYDGDYSIEYKCRSCGHIWRSEMPE